MTSSERSLPATSSNSPAALGSHDHLSFAVAIAQIDENTAAVIAIYVDPTAKRSLVANMIRPQLAAGMGA